MYKASATAQLCIFGADFILGLIAVGMFNNVAVDFIPDARTRFLTVSVLQAVIVFCIPSLIAAYFNHKDVCQILSLNVIPDWKALTGVLVTFAVGFCFFNQIIYWNDTVTLPESMAGIEAKLREMENAARDTSKIIMADASILGLIENIFVVGIITGFAEELFFRAGLQRILSEKMPKVIAIWVSAVIFSTLHFQFFGFIPRVLLGAFFGYLYVWTGSIWVAIFAHALNNSIVVFFEWLTERGVISTNFDSIGVTGEGFPIIALISFFLFVILMKYRKVWFFKSQPRQSKITNYGSTNY